MIYLLSPIELRKVVQLVLLYNIMYVLIPICLFIPQIGAVQRQVNQLTSVSTFDVTVDFTFILTLYQLQEQFVRSSTLILFSYFCIKPGMK